MRLTRIEFRGYKRLLSTRCNVDGRLIAFVGPNEAGKSSVLEALQWLSDDSGSALPSYLRSRGEDVDDGTEVVRAVFTLEPDDISLVQDVEVDEPPRRLILAKTAGGQVRTGMDPRVIRPSDVFATAVTALSRVELAPLPYEDEIQDGGAQSAIHEAIGVLTRAAEGMQTLSDDEGAVLARIADMARNPPTIHIDDEVAPRFARDETLADLIERALALGSAPDPNDVMRLRLRDHAPDFVLFGEGDRSLSSVYELADDALRGNPPRALRNLLVLGETTVENLWSAVQLGDITALRTLIRRVNERLRQRVQPMWRQAQLTVSVNIDGTILQIFIDELDENGSTVALHERSDGLKAFIALACFLATRVDRAILPILLIDEAETHLHYDAQADLLDVLQEADVAQVLYTTHSPGCLPPDLGTGVRLVAPDERNRDVSNLRNDFWSSNQPGYSPLLFAMGAGAAAFAACRRAVMGEGPTEMIVLPTMLRIATGLSTLRYQVAPGLSALSKGEFGNEVAARLAYVVDGDSGGEARAKQLMAAGVDEQSIERLPAGFAVEDLLDPQCYVDAVNAVLHDSGQSSDRIELSDLSDQKPISKAVESWCQQRSLNPPGKPIVANYLVQSPDVRIRLTSEGTDTLTRLHDRFCQLLEC